MIERSVVELKIVSRGRMKRCADQQYRCENVHVYSRLVLSRPRSRLSRLGEMKICLKWTRSVSLQSVKRGCDTRLCPLSCCSCANGECLRDQSFLYEANRLALVTCWTMPNGRCLVADQQWQYWGTMRISARRCRFPELERRSVFVHCHRFSSHIDQWSLHPLLPFQSNTRLTELRRRFHFDQQNRERERNRKELCSCSTSSIWLFQWADWEVERQTLSQWKRWTLLSRWSNNHEKQRSRLHTSFSLSTWLSDLRQSPEKRRSKHWTVCRQRWFCPEDQHDASHESFRLNLTAEWIWEEASRHPCSNWSDFLPCSSSQSQPFFCLSSRATEQGFSSFDLSQIGDGHIDCPSKEDEDTSDSPSPSHLHLCRSLSPSETILSRKKTLTSSFLSLYPLDAIIMLSVPRSLFSVYSLSTGCSFSSRRSSSVDVGLLSSSFVHWTGSSPQRRLEDEEEEIRLSLSLSSLLFSIVDSMQFELNSIEQEGMNDQHWSLIGSFPLTSTNFPFLVWSKCLSSLRLLSIIPILAHLVRLFIPMTNVINCWTTNLNSFVSAKRIPLERTIRKKINSSDNVILVHQGEHSVNPILDLPLREIHHLPLSLFNRIFRTCVSMETIMNSSVSPHRCSSSRCCPSVFRSMFYFFNFLTKWNIFITIDSRWRESS